MARWKWLLLALPVSTGCVLWQVPASTTTIQTRIVVGGSEPVLQSRLGISVTATQRVDERVIHETLDGSGTWRDDPEYGNVWVPAVTATGENFVPYGTQGRWQLSDAGWYWQSRLVWGWLVFHYGRWTELDGEWAWVPGGQFAPAWVDWRVAPGWVGWAPTAPHGAWFTVPYAFCRMEAFMHESVWTHVIYGSASTELYNISRALPVDLGVGGVAYVWGPSVRSFTQDTLAPAALPLGEAWNNEIGSRVVVEGAMPPNPLPARGADTLAWITSPHDEDPGLLPPNRTDLDVVPESGSHPRLRETVSLGVTDDFRSYRVPEVTSAPATASHVTNIVNNTVIMPVTTSYYQNFPISVPSGTVSQFQLPTTQSPGAGVMVVPLHTVRTSLPHPVALPVGVLPVLSATPIRTMLAQ